MANLFESIPFIGGVSGSGVIFVIIWTFILVVMCMCILAVFFLLLHFKRTTPIIEVDLVNHRIRSMRGLIRKDKKDGMIKLFVSKLKKVLKKPQQKDCFIKGKKDMIFLLKDNNGLHHTLRLPKWDDIKDLCKEEVTEKKEKKGFLAEKKSVPKKTEKGIKAWFKSYFKTEYNEQKDAVKDIFFLPNPHEDLEWLANQCVEADKEFKIDKWWQHPNIMVLGVGMICLIMWIMTMILTGKYVL